MGNKLKLTSKGGRVINSELIINGVPVPFTKIKIEGDLEGLYKVDLTFFIRGELDVEIANAKINESK